MLLPFRNYAQTSTINCPDCGGAGSKRCFTCSGSGKVMWIGPYGPQWSNCNFCNGRGTHICISCGGGGKFTINNTNYNNNSSNNGGTSNTNNGNASTQNSQSKKCNHCSNGRQTIERSINVATFGIKPNMKTCSECGSRYDSNQWAHFHQQCSYCRGRGYIN